MYDMNHRGHCSRTEMGHHHEITAAASFASSLLKMNGGLSEHQRQVFQECLQDSMRVHYKHHWYPDRPLRGSAYRCIRINKRVTMDPLVAKAADRCGLTGKRLFDLLPLELTLWVDPFQVCYRIGEDGSICTLYEAITASPVPLADLPCKATSSPAEPATSSPIASTIPDLFSPVASPPVPPTDLPRTKKNNMRNHFLMNRPGTRAQMSMNGQMLMHYMPMMPCYQIEIPLYYYRPSWPCYHQIPVYYRSC